MLVSQVVTNGSVALRLRLKVHVLDTIFEKDLETDITLRVMETFRAENIHPPAILHRQITGNLSSGDQAAMLTA